MTHNKNRELNVLMRKFHRNWINNCIDELANSNTAVSGIHKVKFSHLPDYYLTAANMIKGASLIIITEICIYTCMHPRGNTGTSFSTSSTSTSSQIMSRHCIIHGQRCASFDWNCESCWNRVHCRISMYSLNV